MENSPQQFRRQMATNDKMRERLDILMSSPEETVEVKKTLLSLLGAWITKYKGEPGTRALAGIYENGLARFGKKPRSRSGSSAAQPSSSSPEPSSPQHRRSMPPPAKPARPVEEPTKKRTKPRSQSSAGATFHFQTAKPKIIQEIALANQHANQLANALRLVNTSADGWEIQLQHDQRLQDIRQDCEESKKIIVKYARLVEDEEWIGTLLTTNEELLKSLDMYDIMAVGEIPATFASILIDDDDLNQDLAGLQLVSVKAPLYDGNDDDPDNPFADPFADPVDVSPQPTRQRQNEYVL
ncbi:hypothetical protein DM01DRAFT_1333987 [Hesseltinella vesiculosa]|uniref:VHS domain-containing protein n=1 Tax=Hesseltinella vesiculosa TaxID=101127 RepID=A0A1X2GMP9_9FUNG|nr:hypothetical protein DM01DRAFT_1333987 [Hesseltinella vesiculosa]